MSTLRAQVALFTDVLEQCATDATVYQIPLYPDGLVPERIEPVRVNGHNALIQALHALRSFSRPRDQHPGSVLRLPGVICADKDLVKLIESINKVKSQLKEFIHSNYPDSRSRNHFCRSQFPGRVMLQVYRKLYVSKTPAAVRFTWSPYTEASKTLTRQQTLDLLLKRRTSGFDHLNENRFRALEMAIETVQQSSSTTAFAIKKPRSPYPIATVYHSQESDRKKSVIPLSTPLILQPSESSEPVDIGNLPAYDMSVRRKTRTDKQHMELLFKPLYLYVRP